MSRLTQRNFDGSVGISQFRYYNYDDFQKLTKKLAEYEDLEEQGLLLKLPCKVGDTVWYITPDDSIALAKKTIYEAEVVRFYFMKNKEGMAIDVYAEQRSTEFPLLSDIGKTVFLTKEEAEQELKRLEGEADGNI